MPRRCEQLGLFGRQPPAPVDFDDEPSTPYDPSAPSGDPWGLAPAGVDPDDLQTVAPAAPEQGDEAEADEVVFGRDEIAVAGVLFARLPGERDESPLPDDDAGSARSLVQDDDAEPESAEPAGWPSPGASAVVSSTPTFWHVEHAFAQNEAATYGGGDHLVLDVAFSRGRLHRAPGDALCRRRRAFLCIAPPGPSGEPHLVTCRKCREIAARHGFDLSNPRKPPAPKT